ncbi:hypothetical protein QUF58_14360, partial [Anaerolineales bacterium HSG24]|nr:hypothetical protein [Anaerolineales bacterium HSG24]
ILACVLAELFARLLGTPYDIGDEAHRTHQCDLRVGWRGVPDASVTIDWENYEHQFVLNSQGMHDKNHPLKKGEHVFRILMLGDSMVEALEVAENETSHQVLEDTLNAKTSADIAFEVINAGVFAWGPPQALEYYRVEGKTYKPDLVLAVWFPGNDLLDVLPDHIMTSGPDGGVHCFAPYFAICDGQFDPTTRFTAPGISPSWQQCSTHRKILTNTLNSIYYYSRLYQHLAALLIKVYEKDAFSTNLYAPWLDYERNDDVLNQAYQLTTGVYSQLSSEANQAGAETALIIAPINEAVNFDVNPEFRAFMIEREPILKNGNSQLPNLVFTELMEAKGVPVLDLHPAFVSHMKNGGKSIYWSNTAIHWNILGNKLAGEQIAHWLIEQELVPASQN